MRGRAALVLTGFGSIVGLFAAVIWLMSVTPAQDLSANVAQMASELPPVAPITGYAPRTLRSNDCSGLRNHRRWSLGCHARRWTVVTSRVSHHEISVVKIHALPMQDPQALIRFANPKPSFAGFVVRYQ